MKEIQYGALPTGKYKTRFSQYPLRALSLAVALTGANAGFAATSDAASGAVLEEIIVTSRKREESLMETPVSITAFGGDALTAMNIASADQIAEQTPGLVFDSTSNISGSANSSSIFIRGIGQRDYTLAVEPGVGIYVDDVYLAHSIGNVIDVVDVERIEILRGPQGTLFGRNTIGGAVRVVTKKPSDEYEGAVEFIVGEDNRRDVKAQINIPLNDELFVRFSGLTQDRDGFVNRPFLEGKAGDKDSTSLIGQMRWLASDNLTADWLVTYTQDRSNGAPVILLKAETGAGNPARFASDIAPVLDPKINDFLFGPEFVGWDGDGCPCTDYSDTNIPQDLDTWSTALTLDWQLSDALSLKSITAYRNLETNYGRDADHVPELQNIDLFFYSEYEQWSQELQLSGSGENLDWILGAYYYKEEGQSDDLISFLSFDLLSGGGFETEDIALFGQATYHLTDKLDVTLGVRYTDEEKTAIIDGINHQVIISTLPPGEAFKVPRDEPLQVVAPGTFVDTVQETEPYVNLSYQWNDDLMTYISYSEGFKGGGVQVRNGGVAVLPRFGPEFAEVIELGAKWSLFDGRMNLSGAVFRTDYTDLQLTVNVLEPVPSSIVQNGGDAEIDGFELEAVILPTPDLHIIAGVSVLDAEFTSLTEDALRAGLTLDHELPNAPELQWNLSVAYDIHTANGIFTPRVDYSYSDEQFNDGPNSLSIKRDETDMLNLSLGYESEDGNWSGALFLQNTLDEQVILAGFDGGFYADGAISRPREWGLRIRRSF